MIKTAAGKSLYFILGQLLGQVIWDSFFILRTTEVEGLSVHNSVYKPQKLHFPALSNNEGFDTRTRLGLDLDLTNGNN